MGLHTYGMDLFDLLDDDDVLLTQECEKLEDQFQACFLELPCTDDIMLTQECEKVEETLDDAQLTQWIVAIEEKELEKQTIQTGDETGMLLSNNASW